MNAYLSSLKIGSKFKPIDILMFDFKVRRPKIKFMKQKISKPAGTLFFKGMFMGLSIALPGISGGTMAFILGIYTKLIDEIAKFQVRDFKSPQTFFKKYDWLFLTPLLIGLICALVLFVFLAPPLITTFRFEFYSLIFGFVLASFYSPLKEVEKTLKTLVLFICFAFLSFGCFYLTETVSFSREQVPLLWVFSRRCLGIFGPSGAGPFRFLFANSFGPLSLYSNSFTGFEYSCGVCIYGGRSGGTGFHGTGNEVLLISVSL